MLILTSHGQIYSFAVIVLRLFSQRLKPFSAMKGNFASLSQGIKTKVCACSHSSEVCFLLPYRNPTDPVFVIQHLGCWKPLSRQTADPTFKAALSAVGADASAYSWSSFRRGGATSGFIATGDVESLREHGDWKSNAYTRYLALPASKRVHIVSALQNILN